MAIKSKGRSRPRQAARAPRRGPVEVPKPFFTRRWVQLVLVFILGLGVFGTGVWVKAGLQDERDRRQQDAQRQALQLWKTQVESAFGPLGRMQDPLPPAVGESIRGVVKSISAGKAQPEGMAEQLGTAAEMLTTAADALDAYELSESIRDLGFDAGGANTITVSRTEMVQALHLYAVAASLGADATTAEPEASKAMGARALQIVDAADSILEDAWRGYRLALGPLGLLADLAPAQAP